MLKESDLHNYQRECVKYIIKNPFSALLLEMGLGKTTSTLTAINRLIYEDFEISSVLIIAPKFVAETVWSDEIQKWSHLRNLTISKVIGNEKKRRAALAVKSDIHIISRDNIAWLVGEYGGSKLPWEMLVIDESSSFKNHDAIRFKSLKPIQPSFHRVVLLTGTFAPNGLIDIWPQMWLLDRGERLGKTITAYRSKYFSKNYSGFGYAPTAGADEKIHAKIKDICMSLKSADYLKLPERIDTFINVVLPDNIKKRYDAFEREKVLEMLENGDTEITAMNAAALSNKLLQFAGGAVYDEDRNVHEMHACKLDACEEFIENANGKPVFIAYSYKHELERLLIRLKKYKPVKLKTQEHIKDWNAGKIKVMLAHPASASHGLNLQEGHTMALWFSLNWSLELYQQFNKRLHRQGRKYPVVIGHLIAQGTEDETVRRALDRKGSTQDILMEVVKAKLKKYGLSYKKIK